MITLKVEEYCHNCPEFAPDVDRVHEEYRDFDFETYTHIPKVICETTVACLHRHRCMAIYQKAVEFVDAKNNTASDPNGIYHNSNACGV